MDVVLDYKRVDWDGMGLGISGDVRRYRAPLRQCSTFINMHSHILFMLNIDPQIYKKAQKEIQVVARFEDGYVTEGR